MPDSIDLAKNALVAVTHDSLVSLRTATKVLGKTVLDLTKPEQQSLVCSAMKAPPRILNRRQSSLFATMWWAGSAQ